MTATMPRRWLRHTMGYHTHIWDIRQPLTQLAPTQDILTIPTIWHPTATLAAQGIPQPQSPTAPMVMAMQAQARLQYLPFQLRLDRLITTPRIKCFRMLFNMARRLTSFNKQRPATAQIPMFSTLLLLPAKLWNHTKVCNEHATSCVLGIVRRCDGSRLFSWSFHPQLANILTLLFYQLAFISWLSLRQCWGKSRRQFLQQNASHFVDISCSSWTFGRFGQDVLYQASFMSPTHWVTQVLQSGFRASSWHIWHRNFQQAGYCFQGLPCW